MISYLPRLTRDTLVHIAMLSVFMLSGLHAKDVSALSLAHNGVKTKDVAGASTHSDDATSTNNANKIADHAHTHIDKTMFKSVVKEASDQRQAADRRMYKRELRLSDQFYDDIEPISAWSFLFSFARANLAL